MLRQIPRQRTTPIRRAANAGEFKIRPSHFLGMWWCLARILPSDSRVNAITRVFFFFIPLKQLNLEQVRS